MHVEAEMGALVPEDAGLVPVAPKVSNLVGGNDAVPGRAEDIAALFGYPRRKAQWRHHLQYFADHIVHQTMVFPVANL